MRTIWKYPCLGKRHVNISLPANSQVIAAYVEGGDIGIWAMVDTSEPNMETRYFHIYGTGWSIGEENLLHIATIQDEFSIWHVFEEKK